MNYRNTVTIVYESQDEMTSDKWMRNNPLPHNTASVTVLSENLVKEAQRNYDKFMESCRDLPRDIVASIYSLNRITDDSVGALWIRVHGLSKKSDSRYFNDDYVMPLEDFLGGDYSATKVVGFYLSYPKTDNAKYIAMKSELEFPLRVDSSHRTETKYV